MRLLRSLMVMMTLCAAPAAYAETAPVGAWPNGCDPDTQFADCEILALIYEHGPQFFPKDPDRAQALRADLRATAFRRCTEGDAAACTPMAKHVMSDTSLDLAAQVDLARQSFASMEDRCRGGDPDMCDARVWLSYGSEFTNLREPVDAMAAASGGPGWDARFGQTDVWAEIASQVRRDALARAKTACYAGDSAACLTEARLATAMADLARTAPLLDSCVADHVAAGIDCQRLAGLLDQMRANAPDRYATTTQRLTQACTIGLAAPCGIADAFLPEADSAGVYAAACMAGEGSSCHRLGTDTLNAWIKDGRRDAALLERATDLLDQGCTLGDALACHTREHLSKG